MRPTLLIFLVLIPVSTALSQKKAGTVYSNLYELGMNSLDSGKFDTAYYYFNEALTLSKAQNNVQKTTESTMKLGDVLIKMGRRGEGIERFHQVVVMALDLGDTVVLGRTYNRLGNAYLDTNDFDTALFFYQKAALVAENAPEILANSLGNIGLVHFRLKDYIKADDYFNRSVELAKEIHSKPVLASGYQRLGLIARKSGDYDVALQHYQASLELFRTLLDRRNEASLVQNIGNIYYEMKSFDQAISWYLKGLKIASEIDDDIGSSYLLIALGETYLQKSDTSNAENYLLQAKEISSSSGVKLIYMDACEGLSSLYANQHQYEKALKERILFDNIKDSIYNEHNVKKIAEMEAKYQADRRDKEISLLNAENKINLLELQRRKLERNSLLLALLTLIIFLFGLFRIYHLKEKAHRDLRKTDEIKSQFVTNISHEFRTPLALIIGPVENRLAKEVSPEWEQELLSIRKHSRMLLDLVNQLLDLSKIEAGFMRLKLRKDDFGQFLKLSATSFDSLALQKDITVSVEIPSQPLTLYFDPDKCQKIIYNLLSNALKFTPNGGQIWVKAEVQRGVVRVIFKDTGVGIPQNEQGHVFDRFYQVQNESNRSGTGVGMALVKELAVLHHGNIYFESTEGRGTTFFLELPMAATKYEKSDLLNTSDRPESEASIGDPTYGQTAISSNSSDKFAVLLVEDNLDLSAFVSEQLIDEYNLYIAENGDEGLRLAIEHVPDVIISDIMMEGLDGLELCRRIKSNEKTSHIPFIMLTAKSDLDSKIEGLQKGADDYLLKPFDSRELKARIENLIEQRDRLRQGFEKHITLEPSQLIITPPDEAFLKRARSVVEKHMADCDFSVELFQKEMAMSRMQLHRKLKALLGCSASEFIRDQRMKRASTMLQIKGITVAEAAYQVGFSSPSYFSKCFKEQFNMSPKEYSDLHAKHD